MDRRRLGLFIFALALSTALVACGGGGNGKASTDPPAGSAFVRVRMMQQVSGGGPAVEIVRNQATLPLTFASDSMSHSDPNFEQTLEADIDAIADLFVSELRALTEGLLAADAALSLGEQKLATAATSEYLMFSGGPYSALFWPDPLRIQNHALTDTPYFESQIRQRLRERIRFYVLDQDGKIKHTKTVWLEFIFG